MVSRWLDAQCAENAGKMHGWCTMAGTHRSRMGGGVPAHIVLPSPRRPRPLANSTALCVYQFSITIQLSNLWSPCLTIFNYFSIVIKHNARISMGLVSFQFAFTTQTLSSNINLSRGNRMEKILNFFPAAFHWNGHDFHIIYLMQDTCLKLTGKICKKEFVEKLSFIHTQVVPSFMFLLILSRQRMKIKVKTE